MDIIEGPLEVETLKAASQPQRAIGMERPEVGIPDDQVRAAIAQAEAEGRDPEALRVSELPQGPVSSPAQPDTSKAPEVPPKFLKPDGVVDVEKLKASTEQLDEAIKQKESKLEVVNRTIEDYVREYQDKEVKFKSLPNPERLAASLPTPAVAPTAQIPMNPQLMPDEQVRQILENDYRQNPLATTAQLIQIAIEKEMEPLKRQERLEAVRRNLTELARKDFRVLDPQIYAAINAKLDSDPDYWKLKNPHKAAWLDVKDELRLGDLAPQGTSQAQPSRPPSPILGGGVPPSAPSSSVKTPQNVLASLDQINLRDKKQEAEGDAAIRALFSGR